MRDDENPRRGNSQSRGNHIGRHVVRKHLDRKISRKQPGDLPRNLGVDLRGGDVKQRSCDSINQNLGTLQRGRERSRRRLRGSTGKNGAKDGNDGTRGYGTGLEAGAIHNTTG